MELKPKQVVVLRDSLNKKIENVHEFTDYDGDPNYILFYKLNFATSRKIHLNCFIKVTQFSIYKPEFLNLLPKNQIQISLKKKVIKDNDILLKKFFGLRGDIIDNYYVNFNKSSVQEINNHNKSLR